MFQTNIAFKWTHPGMITSPHKKPPKKRANEKYCTEPIVISAPFTVSFHVLSPKIKYQNISSKKKNFMKHKIATLEHNKKKILKMRRSIFFSSNFNKFWNFGMLFCTFVFDHTHTYRHERKPITKFPYPLFFTPGWNTVMSFESIKYSHVSVAQFQIF